MTWEFEYTLNNSSFTAAQWAAINSGATTANIQQIGTNTNDISTNKGTMDGHIANTSNPHNVTKNQLGLGNVDNTSDLNKPVSTATQNALGQKQDKLPTQTGQAGKFLTTNGSSLSWGSVDALPTQTGQSGKFLTTNGTTASWGNPVVATFRTWGANE